MTGDRCFLPYYGQKRVRKVELRRGSVLSGFKRGRPLADRSQARTAYRPPLLMAGFLHLALPCCSGRTRFLIAGYDRIVPATHMDQAVCDEQPPPWRNPAPEKRWCRRSVRATITDPWLAASRVQTPTGSPGRRPGYNNTGGDGRSPSRLAGSCPDPFTG